MSDRRTRIWPPEPPRVAALGLLLLTLGLWQLTALTNRPDFVLTPTEVAGHFVTALGSGEVLPHVGASLARALPGFALGSLVGVSLGLLAGVARSVARTVSPPIFLTYPVPKIVFFPIFMLWFGIG